MSAINYDQECDYLKFGTPTKLFAKADLPPSNCSLQMEVLDAVQYDECLEIPEVRYDENYHRYVPIPRTSNEVHDTDIVKEGKHFRCTTNTVFATAKNGDKVEISNTTIEIKQRLIIHDLHDVTETWLLNVFCSAWTDGMPRDFSILKSDFKQVFSKLRKEFPEITLYSKKPEAIEEYIASVAAEADLAAIVEKSRLAGWWRDSEGRVRYELGIDPFYSTSKIPLLSNDRFSIFQKGFYFLEVGHGSSTCDVLFTFAHIPYLLFWFREGAADFTSVLYLNGASNMLKTATATVLANVFDTNRKNAKTRLGSTIASITGNMRYLQDQLICLDDSSNSEKVNQGKIMTNLETAIRVAGDSAFDTKMKPGNKEIFRHEFRGAIITTGEEQLNLGRSSLLRVLEAPVDATTFDGNVLRVFQSEPRIMSCYFALFIKYLTEYGPMITKNIVSELPQLREKLALRISVKRHIDAAAGLYITTNIIADFAKWCNAYNDCTEANLSRLRASSLSIVEYNQRLDIDEKPTHRFIKMLFQLIGNKPNTHIAADELTYAKSESVFIGFETDKEYWIKPEASYELVVNGYKSSNELFTTQFNTIKQALYNEKLSVGNVTNSGKKEYVLKSKKGSRKRMLVLVKDKIQNLLNT